MSPSYGSVNTATVSIIGPVGSGFTGATRVSVNGVKMFHVVRSDRKIDFTMKPGVAGTTVDVVLVKAGGVVMTFTQSYSFEGSTRAEGSTSTGATLTTTNGVTITVPPQTALRPASAEVGGGLVITYTPVDVPAVPPGDVPLSFFDVSVAIDGAPVSILTNAAVGRLSVLRRRSSVVGRRSSGVGRRSSGAKATTPPPTSSPRRRTASAHTCS